MMTVEPKFTTQRVNHMPGYIEHVYLHEGDRKLLVATVYSRSENDVLDQCYKFSCKWKMFSDCYKTVADCKHDLFKILDERCLTDSCLD
jgi:hypothetical protein